MANTILVKVVFGHGIFFHFFRFPEVDGSSVEDSRAHFLLIASFIFIQTVE
jgi:hypothetical protein